MVAEPFLKIGWNDEDLKKALKNNGFKPTDENIKKIKRSGLKKLLEDNSIEEGWDTIFWVIEQQAEHLEER